MSKNKESGFTLIELLVVIAIIGILAAVVLASLNSARSKGNDAAIKSNLNYAMKQAEIILTLRTTSPGTYTGVCGTGLIDSTYTGSGVNVLAAAKAAGLASVGTGAGTGTTATCNDSAGAWAAEVPLAGSTVGSPKMWCIDSLTHNSQNVNKNITAISPTVCP